MIATGKTEIFSPLSLLTGGFLSMLLIAWLAARLLGVRHRSWAAALLAGSVGWVLTGLFAIAVSDGRVETLNSAVVIVFAVLAAMTVTAVIDLLHAREPRHRPLLSVPHPVRAVHTGLRRVRRYLRVLRIASRHGLAPYLGLHGTPETAAAAAASARLAMEEAGGVFVKLGQLLAGRADLLPPEARREFARLQERAMPADPTAIEELIAGEFKAPVGEVFEHFDADPVAAASIAQAHRARLSGGEDVVVKIQRPGIDVVVEDDLAITRWLARLAERHTGWGRTYRVEDLAEEFGSALRDELDFRVEARNVREAALALTGDPGVVVPHVYEERSTRRVLVLERLEGAPLVPSGGPPAPPEDARKLGDSLLRAVLAPMMAGERFHADPHPGNVRLLCDGRIGLLDFGATGRLDAFEQASVVDILLAIRGHDPTLLLDAVRQVAAVPPDVDETQLEHALARFLARHISAAASPDAGMLTELLRVFLTFGIALPAGTTTMFRALVTLQGTLEVLCPRYPLIDAAQELAGDLLLHRVTPHTLAEAAQQELVTAAPVMRRMPRHLDRIATQLERGDLRLQTRLFADPGDARVMSRLVEQVVLVLASATFGGIAIGLLALTGGPEITSGLTMYQAFGYAGLTMSLILLLRVLVGVLRGDDRGRTSR
jgi:ubiquinone biosynthesis protein